MLRRDLFEIFATYVCMYAAFHKVNIAFQCLFDVIDCVYESITYAIDFEGQTY